MGKAETRLKMLIKAWTIRNYLEKLVCMILVLAQIHQCKKEYFNKFSFECRQKQGDSKDKKAKRIAFSDIVTIINDNCIGKNNPMQLVDLLGRYKKVYIDEGGD